MARPKPIEKLMQTGYRVSKTRKKELEEVAKLRGQSVQAIIDEAVELRLGLTEGFWDQIVSLAEKLKLPAAAIIANMIIKASCFQFAWIKVFDKEGDPLPPGLFKEFRFDADGLLTGERLSETLVKEYTEKITAFKEKARQIKKADRPSYHFSNEDVSIMLGGQL